MWRWRQETEEEAFRKTLEDLREQVTMGREQGRQVREQESHSKQESHLKEGEPFKSRRAMYRRTEASRWRERDEALFEKTPFRKGPISKRNAASP